QFRENAHPTAAAWRGLRQIGSRRSPSRGSRRRHKNLPHGDCRSHAESWLLFHERCRQRARRADVRCPASSPPNAARRGAPDHEHVAATTFSGFTVNVGAALSIVLFSIASIFACAGEPMTVTV